MSTDYRQPTSACVHAVRRHSSHEQDGRLASRDKATATRAIRVASDSVTPRVRRARDRVDRCDAMGCDAICRVAPAACHLPRQPDDDDDNDGVREEPQERR